MHFLCQHYQLDKKRSAVKGPLILEFTFCFVEQVLGMSTLFHFLYHQPTKTLGVPLLCFHSTHVNMTKKKTTITITTFNSLEECFIRILPWHSTGMYGTPDINTDKLCMASSQNPLFLPQLIDPDIKIPVMSAAQVSVILILTQILVGQTMYAKNRSCIAGKEHEWIKFHIV